MNDRIHRRTPRSLLALAVTGARPERSPDGFGFVTHNGLRRSVAGMVGT